MRASGYFPEAPNKANRRGRKQGIYLTGIALHFAMQFTPQCDTVLSNMNFIGVIIKLVIIFHNDDFFKMQYRLAHLFHSFMSSSLLIIIIMSMHLFKILSKSLTL